MSTIPISVTEEQFEQHIRSYISMAQRGYECKIALYKILNYILYRVHTGCQWAQLPIAADGQHPEKRNQLATGLLSFPEMERGWQFGTGVAAQYPNDPSGIEFVPLEPGW